MAAAFFGIVDKNNRYKRHLLSLRLSIIYTRAETGSIGLRNWFIAVNPFWLSWNHPIQGSIFYCALFLLEKQQHLH